MQTTALLKKEAPKSPVPAIGKFTNPLQQKAIVEKEDFLQMKQNPLQSQTNLDVEERKLLQMKQVPVQRMDGLEDEEEEPLQMKQNPLQLVEDEDDKLLQRKEKPLQLKKEIRNPLQLKQSTDNPLQLQAEETATPQPNKNNTGLPDNLQVGIEFLSGFSMDDVQVHYNSDKPAQLQALAYTQGTDIHVATGQEKHLPHEVWHVVQQKQGRVQPTMQMKQGVTINDERGLEDEADTMGIQLINKRDESHIISFFRKDITDKSTRPNEIIQRTISEEWMPEKMIEQKFGFNLKAYFNIPIGNNYEYFVELVKKADDIGKKERKDYRFEEKYEELNSLEDEELSDINKQKLIRLAENINYVLETPERINKALLLKGSDLKKEADKYKLDSYQKQLRNDKSVNKESILIKIEGLEKTDSIQPIYDKAWLTKDMTSSIEVDSDGAVVGATIRIKEQDETIRRRLTVSKGRHMFDFMDSETSEPDNSLISSGVSVASVEEDIKELAIDFKNKYELSLHKSAYVYTTKSGRVYRINKTLNEYPHCYPISGLDVISLNTQQYNFLVNVKMQLSQNNNDDYSKSMVAESICKNNSIRISDVQSYISLMKTLKVKVYIIEAFEKLLSDTESNLSVRERFSQKHKHTLPRKKPDQPKLPWTASLKDLNN